MKDKSGVDGDMRVVQLEEMSGPVPAEVRGFVSVWQRPPILRSV